MSANALQAAVVCEDADVLEHEHPGRAPADPAEKAPGKSPRPSPRSALSPPLSPPSSEGSPDSPRAQEAARVPESPRSVYFDAEEDAFSLTPRGSIENGGFFACRTPRASADLSAFFLGTGPHAGAESAASAGAPAPRHGHGGSPPKVCIWQSLALLSHTQCSMGLMMHAQCCEGVR